MKTMSSAFSDEVFSVRMGREGARSGELTISLIWNDIADLDLHVYAPSSEHIYYGHKQSECGGWLDVDMNPSPPGPNSKNSLEPIENVFWHSSPSGFYKVVVYNFKCHCDKSTVFTDSNRLVPFRCVVKRNGRVESFEGKVRKGSPVTAFEFMHEGTGAVGSYVVLPGDENKTTFKAACAKHKVSYNVGTGYYAVARMEKISKKKLLLLHHISTDTFTIGTDAVKDKLGWPKGVDLKKTVKDIPDGYRLFVQSTSHNRVIKPNTHVLVKVGMEEALNFRAKSLAQEGNKEPSKQKKSKKKGITQQSSKKRKATKKQKTTKASKKRTQRVKKMRKAA